MMIFDAEQESLADVSEEIECMACGTVIREAETRCSKCGWSYEDSPESEKPE